MKPRIPIHDPQFRYRDSASTDIRLTFAKARRRIALENAAEAAVKVTPIKRKA